MNCSHFNSLRFYGSKLILIVFLTPFPDIAICSADLTFQKGKPHSFFFLSERLVGGFAAPQDEDEEPTATDCNAWP
jgi:hypothetical protein